MFSNKLFLFSYEILNAPSKRENQVFVEFLPSFFQCCFMSETQVLMTVSNFVWFFLGIISWKGALLFNDGCVGNEGGIGFDWGDFQKNHGMRGRCPHLPCPLPLWETLNVAPYGLWTPAMLGMPIGCWLKQ